MDSLTEFKAAQALGMIEVEQEEVMDEMIERKQVFQNCHKCGKIYAQCFCKASSDSREGLASYLAIRDQVAKLEALGEGQCKCGDFYTCDVCRELQDKEHSLRMLLLQFGDDWAVRLNSLNSSILAATHPQAEHVMETLCKPEGGSI